MTRLTMEQISRENENCDVKSATSLQLSHRALSDVSCLRNFQNLEKLDISYNCLTSLEGLSGCVNLKWLQVFENKLETLKGVESLSKLTVLNAGRNKLEKMEEICVLSNLRALILNDNNISSICKLDQMKHLNTLVLSRNPIREIGNSLKKVTSMIKLSFSHCKLETIGSSLVACVDLKEARFSHNEITALPEDLSKNIRLRTLDIGNNLIEKLPEIKILSSINNLRNLNLLGNPIAENEKLMKKVRRLVPNLRIFNSKPTDSSNSSLKVSEKSSVNSTKADSSPPEGSKKRKKGESIKETIGNITDAERVKKNKSINSSTFFDVSEAKTSKNSSKKGCSTSNNDSTADASVLKDSKKKKKSSSNTEILEKNTDAQKSNIAVKENFTENFQKKSKMKSTVIESGTMIKEFDDAEIPFKDLIDSGKTIEDSEGEKGGETRRNDKSLDGIVFKNCNKKRYNKNMDSDLRTIFSSRHEIGMGGPSTWNV